MFFKNEILVVNLTATMSGVVRLLLLNSESDKSNFHKSNSMKNNWICRSVVPASFFSLNIF